MTNRTPTRRYLGRVVNAPQSNSAYHFATVRVLTASDDATRRWLPGGEDMSGRFPSRGCVHWHDAGYGGLAVKDRIVSFEIDPDVDRPERSEQYQLTDPVEAWEVLDFSGWDSDVAVQRALTSDDGALIRPEPLAMRGLVRLPSGLCAGPFRLKRGAVDGNFAVEGLATGNDLTAVSCWRPEADEIDAVFADGYRRHFVSPFAAVASNAQPQNWASDETVARRVLDALRKMDPAAIDRVGRAHKIEVTKRLFEEFLACVERGHFGKQVPDVERARAERLRALQVVIDKNEALLEAVVETLHAVPSVQQQLAVRAEAEVTALVEAKLAEQAPALEKAREELERVRHELAEQRDALATIDVEIAQKQSQLNAAVAGYEEAMGERLAALLSRPESAFAELAVVRALAKAVGREASRPTGGPALPVPSSPRARAEQDSARDGGEQAQRPHEDPTGCEPLDVANVAKVLARTAREADVSREAMLAVHGALAAGLVPIVEGQRAYALLRAYGHAVAGGRVHWVPVTPTLLEPADLLGRREAASGRFVPAATGLLGVIADAADREELHLVVLDGCNRAPIEGYLLPILQSAEAWRVGDAIRTIPLASEAALAQDDPFRRFARLGWPPNVLIACIPVDGPAALPIAASVWRHCAMVHASSRSSVDDTGEGVGRADGVQPLASAISATAWRDNLNGGAAADDEARTALLDRAREWQLTGQDFRESEAVCRVLRASGDTSDAPLSIAMWNVLAARAASLSADAADLLRSAPDAQADVREIVDAVARLRV
jgi:hypothetical protein